MTISEMLGRMGVTIDRRGMACCPFHGEKTPSLKVYKETGRGWYCFGCHAGGDVIDMAKRFYGLEFKAALARLNEEFSLGLPLDRQLTRQERKAVTEEIERRKAERAAKKAALEAAENVYWRAYDAWLENESVIADQAPRGAWEEPSEAFAYALTHREEIREALEAAEEEWKRARAG